jgi:hypothetical protein
MVLWPGMGTRMAGPTPRSVRKWGSSVAVSQSRSRRKTEHRLWSNSVETATTKHLAKRSHQEEGRPASKNLCAQTGWPTNGPHMAVVWRECMAKGAHTPTIMGTAQRARRAGLTRGKWVVGIDSA